MAVEGQSRWRTMLWVLSASIALHLVIVAIFFIPAAFRQPEPAPEENVSVELVPPPEEPKPEEKKPPEAKIEEKKPAEKQPEPPKAEKQPEPPPPPAPKPPEQPKSPEAPKPPPKPPEAPKPPEEKPPEQPKLETDTPNAQDTPAKSMLQPLRPVFKFGDKDTGPKKSDGDSAEGGEKPDDAAKPDDPKADPAPAKPAPPDQQPPNVDASDNPPLDKADDKPAADKPPAGAAPLPPDINLPQADAADTNAEKDGAPGQAPDAANVNLSPEQAKALADVAAQPPRPEARPTQPTKAEHLTKAKTLFSLNDGGDDGATTAIGDIPRGVRIGQLCATELREQLRHSAYPPEILPAYRLPGGTVMDVPHSQFRAASQWYNLSFRCEVDEGGTKVVSFAFNIGEAVPRSQWRSRGFPEE